jgi:hypothetical protein
MIEILQYCWASGIPILTLIVLSVGMPIIVFAFVYEYLKGKFYDHRRKERTEYYRKYL